MSSLKPPKTIQEQLDKLKSKNLKICDESSALNILSNVNYYTLKGYLFEHEDKSGNYYNISFEQIYEIYLCDMKMRSLLLYAIESAERNLKTKISYVLSHEYGSLSYMDNNIFKDNAEHDKLLDLFNQSVKRNKKIPFVKHHISKYNSQFPVWVAIELFTLGMIRNLYSNLQTPIQKKIAKSFSIGSIYLDSWIECLSYLRNLCAHYMRLYKLNIQKKPKQSIYHNNNINSYKVFDIIYVLKYLVGDTTEWEEYILPQISMLLKTYSDVISPADYGFPLNWNEYLSYIK